MSMIGNFKTSTDDEIQQLLANPEAITDLLYPDDDQLDGLDIDKTWQAIHCLLTGTAYDGTPPLNFIMGGVPVGEVDVGYGPARVLTSEEVAAVADALAPIDGEALTSRFNAKTFVELQIYPDIWDESAEECIDEYVLPYYLELREFISQASKKGQALIMWVN